MPNTWIWIPQMSRGKIAEVGRLTSGSQISAVFPLLSFSGGGSRPSFGAIVSIFWPEAKN